MRIQPVTAADAPQTQQPPLGSRRPIIVHNSTLSSPQAPQWTTAVKKFFSWFFRFLFSPIYWILPKKKEEPKTPEQDPDVLRAIQKAKAEEAARQNSLPGIIKQTAVQMGVGIAASKGFSWIHQKEIIVLSSIAGVFAAISTHTVASSAVTSSSRIIEKIADFTFPEISLKWKKVGSLAIAIPVVWIASDHFGYSLGWFFFAMTAYNNGYKTFQQISLEEDKQRQMRFQQQLAAQ